MAKRSFGNQLPGMRPRPLGDPFYLIPGKKKWQRGFTPYVPPPPPSGSYDPALDAQLGAARRGYGDLQQDVATGNERATVDYGLTRENLEQSRTRAQEDHDRQIMLLGQSYQRLQRRQAEGARAHGVVSPGLALQAAQIRARNQAQEQQPIDLAMARAGQDISGQEGRLLIDYQRGGIDRAQALQRAGRENTQFGLDIGAEQAFQAAQSGYVPPGRGEPGGMPHQEHVDPRTGQHFRTRRANGFLIYYDPQGREISRRRLPGLVGTVRPGSKGLGR